MLRPVCFIYYFFTSLLLIFWLSYSLKLLVLQLFHSTDQNTCTMFQQTGTTEGYLNDLQKFHQLRCFGHHKSQSFSSHAKLSTRALHADCRIDVLPCTWYQLKSVLSLLKIWYVIFCRNSWKLYSVRYKGIKTSFCRWCLDNNNNIPILSGSTMYAREGKQSAKNRDKHSHEHLHHLPAKRMQVFMEWFGENPVWTIENLRSLRVAPMNVLNSSDR